MNNSPTVIKSAINIVVFETQWLAVFIYGCNIKPDSQLEAYRHGCSGLQTPVHQISITFLLISLHSPGFLYIWITFNSGFVHISLFAHCQDTFFLPLS